MKSYTDIEQSKKLAEILPIESADMWWSKDFIYYNPTAAIGISVEYSNVYTYKFGEDDIPCWSLAALLEALPTIDDGNRNPVVCKDIRLNKWHIVYYSTAVEAKIDSGVYDSLVDACYEMILKLHEQKLL